jgi:hypothetical protein
LQGSWKELIRTGRTAQKKEIDFYYLQYRMGIAHYMLKNYKLAAGNFQNAYQNYYSGDDVLNEYLYYSFLWSDQKAEAVHVESLFSNTLKQKLSPSLYSVFFDYGYNKNGDLESQRTSDISGLIYAGRTLNRDFHFFSAGGGAFVAPKIYITINYSNLLMNQIQQIQENNNAIKDFDHTTKQNQFYGGGSYLLQNGWNFYISLHLIQINKDYTVFEPTGKIFSDTLYKSTDYVLNAGITKDIGNFQFSGGFSLSNLNSEKQTQINGSVVWYPFGNLNLYTVSNFHYHNNMPSSNSGTATSNLIFNQKIGFKLTKIWMEAALTTGELKNYNESNGFVVFNGNDVVKKRYNFSIFVPILKNKFQLSVRYNYFVNESNYLSYSNYTTYQYYSNTYFSQSFTGGVTWNF